MKKRKTSRRRSKGLSQGKTTHRRRRSKGLSEVMSGANMKNSAINSGLGALGGAGSTVGTKLTNTLTKGNVIGNILVGFAVGFLASSLGAPKIGIGYSGGATALALSGGLKDNADFINDDELEEGEIYQTESGEYVKMLNDGSLEYLSEEEVNALSEGEIYPEYSTMNAFQQ